MDFFVCPYQSNGIKTRLGLPVDPFVEQNGSEKTIFRGFTNFFSEVATDLQQKLLILIEPPNIFYEKSTKKVGVVLGAKFGPI